MNCVSSLPKEVCSVILDAECLRPLHTECNMVEPTKECQLVLRHFFNNSGVYCINVSMANDVSLAVASAKVSVYMGKNYALSSFMACETMATTKLLKTQEHKQVTQVFGNCAIAAFF